MEKYISGPLTGIAEALKRDVLTSLDSPKASQHVILASEDIAPLAIQLMFTASQKNDAQLLGSHMPILGRMGFVGSATHLLMMFMDSDSSQLGPISPGCMAHYVDWLGRNQHAKSRLNGATFNGLIHAFERRDASGIEIPELRSNMETAFRQVNSHGRLDPIKRIQLLEEAKHSQDVLFRLGGYVEKAIIITGSEAKPEELKFFESLSEHIGEITWLSTHAAHHSDSRFSSISDGPASVTHVPSMYAAVKLAFESSPSCKEGGYLLNNHIGTFSNLFGLTLCMISASLSLGHRIEWYTLLRGLLGIPHEDSVQLIRDLSHYHEKGLPLDGVNETLGRSNILGKTFATCFHFADDPEAAYRAAYQAVSEVMTKRGAKLEGTTKDIVDDVHLYYRWMSRAASNTQEFYLMACLYPYSGRYPKHHIYSVKNDS